MAKKLIDFGGTTDEAKALAIDDAGRIVVAGSSRQGGTTDTDFAVVRLDPNGQLDSSFDGDGKKTIDFGRSEQPWQWTSLIDEGGRIVVAGSSVQGGTTGTGFAIVRLDPNGQLDSSFDGDGRKTHRPWRWAIN